MSEHSGHHTVHAETAVKPDLVTAVFVTFNSHSVIGDALRATQGCREVSHVIVVDNASTDQTVELIESEFPDVQLVKNVENIGFGRANNVGLALVDTEFAFVLNPDTLPNDEAVQSLMSTASARSDAAILGPSLMDTNVAAKVRTGDLWSLKKTVIPPGQEVDVDFLSGAAMLIRMSHFSQVGFFEDGIFLFFEDDAICMKAKQAGHTLIYSSKAVIPHAKGQSSPPRAELIGLKQCHFVWSRIYLERVKFGNDAAIRLAIRMRRSLRRKMILARFLRDKPKQQLLGSRMLGVRCFLEEQLPPTEASCFTALNPNTDRRNDIPDSERLAG